jgi:Tfp pilus assembly protein PilX
MKELIRLSRNQGSALLICLVLLTVLTLIGISSVENALLEEKMSSNTQFKYTVFQSGMSELDEQFVFLGGDNRAIMNAITSDVSLTDITSPTGISLTSSASHFGVCTRRARLREQIQSMGTSQVIVTEVTVLSELDNTGTRSEQTYGTELPVPSSSGSKLGGCDGS